jgi:uncharacterized protein YybS (DUF2232 family)
VERQAEHAEKLDSILRLKIGDWATLGPGFSILGPVLVGLISTLLTGK